MVSFSSQSDDASEIALSPEYIPNKDNDAGSSEYEVHLH